MSWWRESPIYQATVREGRAAEARRVVLDLGTEKFGTPDPVVARTVESLDDLDTLERLIRRILTASSWQDLVAEATNG